MMRPEELYPNCTHDTIYLTKEMNKEQHGQDSTLADCTRCDGTGLVERLEHSKIINVFAAQYFPTDIKVIYRTIDTTRGGICSQTGALYRRLSQTGTAYREFRKTEIPTTDSGTLVEDVKRKRRIV